MAIFDKRLSNVALATIAKLMSSKKAKPIIGSIQSGEHEINEVIHIHGVMNLGVSYTQENKAKARPWVLSRLLMNEIARLCKKINELAKEGDELYDAQKILGDIVELHVNSPIEAAGKKLSKDVQLVAEALGETTEEDCNGKCTFEGMVDAVEPEDIDDMIDCVNDSVHSKAAIRQAG